MGNRNLHISKKRKADEFYTRLEDIGAGLQYYKDAFRGKVVYCNCDDPRVSNFVKYFVSNFRSLGLKKLVASCYKEQDTGLFGDSKPVPATWRVYEGKELQVLPLHGDGDFRSPECVGLLRQSDVVVTNPPFSLFREYVGQLLRHGKKFIVMGTLNGVRYNVLFPHIMDGTVRVGATRARWFIVPDSYAQIMKHTKACEDGMRLVGMGNVCWYTNIPNGVERHLILHARYSPEKYPKFDDCDAINVDKTKDIPRDYDGVMGVPVSFLEKHDPAQFKIVGRVKPVLGGREIYERILIRRIKR